jgi:hypothetical protein
MALHELLQPISHAASFWLEEFLELLSWPYGTRSELHEFVGCYPLVLGALWSLSALRLAWPSVLATR